MKRHGRLRGRHAGRMQGRLRAKETGEWQKRQQQMVPGALAVTRQTEKSC